VTVVERESEQRGSCLRPDGGDGRIGKVENKVMTADGLRMAELETENLRLTRLVAELLLKNQKLREMD
jgi:hypothetical protein